MVNFTEPVDPSQFATATEVDGLRRTLDEFMKTQDDVNQSIKSSLDKILSQFTINPQMGVPAPEDKGSNIKGKEQVAPPPQFQFPHPHNSNWPRHPQHQHHYKHPSQFVPIHHDEHSYYGMHQQPSHVHWSAQGQFVASDDYGEEEYEYEQDYQEHPAPFHEQDKSLFQPKRAPNFNQQKATTPPQNKPPPPPYQPHNTQPHIQTTHTENRQEKLPTSTQTNYVMQLQNQHRAVARGPKLTFPEFAGEDTDGWIRKAEKYFELVGVPTEDRVKIAVLYITGKAEFWWRGTGCNANTLPWHHFCRMVTDRFNLVSEYEVIGQFHNLKQVGTVVDYVDRFEEMVTMVRRNCPQLPETYYISSFISGLKDSIQYHLQCHRPTALSQAYWYAKRLEQANPSFKKPYVFNQPAKVQKQWTKDKDPATPSMAELKAAGKCFKCREPWVPGHTKICKGKQLYSVILVENEEGKEEVPVIEDAELSEDPEFHDAETVPTVNISMHALTGLPSAASTFALKIHIGKYTAVALVDSGSDESFINAKFAVKTNCKITSVPRVNVAAANGKEMLSDTACLSCNYYIQGHEFTSNFRLLEVQGYDIILGADWIFNHSPVALDLKRRELSITKGNSQIVTLVDEMVHPHGLVIGTKKLCHLLKHKAVGAVVVLQNSQLKQSFPSGDIHPSISALLQEFHDVFQEPSDLPPQRAVDHGIPLIDSAKFINRRPYRLPHHQKDAMEDLIKQLLQANMIRPSVSPYSSPVILVKTKDGSWRLCVDYRLLNANTVKNKYPIPIIEDLLDELFGAKIFSKIDLRFGYHQIRMTDQDIPKTAFTTHLGHFEYLVMPFGLTNAPATFQTLMNTILSDILRKFALVFFDDILIYSTTLSDHITHLRTVLEILRHHKLYAKLSKCTFGQPEIEYLGHVINQAGVATDPSKIAIIQQWPTPQTVTELRAFLGLTGYYRRFIQGYGIICRPLFNALKKNSFSWSDSQEVAFQHLKQLMTHPPVLALPDFTMPFVLEADASGNGIGAVLM